MSSPSKKKILLATRPLTPPWDEASKNFAYFLAKSIVNPELELHILTTPKGLDGMNANVVQHPLYTSQMHHTQAGFPFLQKARLPLHLFTHSYQYDVIHYLFTPTPFNSWQIKNFTFRRPPSIQTIATLREDLFTPDQWKKMFFADHLVVYSDYSRAKLEAAGFTGIERIYPGIDLDLYSPQPKSLEAMKHFNLSEEDFVVTYPGEYSRLGATDMLVEMLTHFQFPMKFIFACRIKNEADARKKKEVEKKLRAAGVLEHVRFTDTWEDMPALYNLSDIVIFPVENMRGKFDIPLVIIEAYACGKPVIVSDLEIFQEFTNPDISVIIPKDNPEVLAQAIENLRLDEDKRKTLGQDAGRFVEQKFDLKETAKKYEKLYLNL